MKEIQVFGHTTVTISTIIKVRDDTKLTEKEILARAKKKFGGIHSYYGNGSDDKLIGVAGDGDTIMADEDIEFDDYFIKP